MPNLIRFDKSGKETSREATKRGRPPAGSVRQENGDLHIYEGQAPAKVPVFDPSRSREPMAVSTAVVTKPKEVVKVEPIEGDIQVTPIEDDETSTPDPVVTSRRRKYKLEKKISLDSFLRACKHMTKVQNGNVITLNYPVIIHESGIPEIKFNSCYNRIEVDLVSNTVALWGSLDAPPKLIVSEVFESAAIGNYGNPTREVGSPT
jgi:hypothetical protein